MGLLKCLHALLLSCLALQSAGLTLIGGRLNQIIKPYKRAPLQDIVTWDEHSVFVRGERVMLYNGEFHPFRYAGTSNHMYALNAHRSTACPYQACG